MLSESRQNSVRNIVRTLNPLKKSSVYAGDDAVCEVVENMPYTSLTPNLHHLLHHTPFTDLPGEIYPPRVIFQTTSKPCGNSVKKSAFRHYKILSFWRGFLFRKFFSHRNNGTSILDLVPEIKIVKNRVQKSSGEICTLVLYIEMVYPLSFPFAKK